MAATATAARLTEAHRLAQARLGANVVRLMLAAWTLLDIRDLDGTFDRWTTIVLPLIRGQHEQSSLLAANYLATFRALELGVEAPPAPVLSAGVDEAAVRTSLLVTGPVAIRSALGRSVPLDRAARTAQVGSARAAMRHALAGGRDTIVDTVKADRSALGWARAASGSACAFCAMLASRGPVYGERSVRFSAHDGCSCGAEPVYRADAAWPAGAERYRDLWEEATADARGADKLTEFRRAYQARTSNQAAQEAAR